MNKKITMKDIAEMASVSRMTVSRYFNGGYVSKENRTKIKEIIETYNFIPNVYAQSLKKNLPIIGVIIPTVVSRTATKLLKGIIDEADRNHYEVIVTSSEYSRHKEWMQYQNFLNLNVKGMIIQSIDLDLYHNIHKDNKRVVFMDQVDFNEMPSVAYKEVQALSELVNDAIIPNADIRKIGYLTDQKSFARRDRYVAQVFEKTPLKDKVTTYYTQNQSRYPININLEKGTLYLCATDRIALNLYETAEKQNFIIGQDIFIAGIGDYSVSAQIRPALTSIQLPYYEAGTKTVELLLNDTSNKVSIEMDCRIVYRDSLPLIKKRGRS